MTVKGTGPGERFDRVTRTAARMFDVPFAALSLIDDGHERFKSRVGLDLAEMPRDASLGAPALGAEGPVVVDDMTADERFAENPLVTADPHLRFYAGQPLHGLDGAPLGVLAVMDRSRRVFSREDRAALKDLAAWAEVELAAVAPPEQARELESPKADLLASAAHQLRTPLTAIMGFADLLEGTEADPKTTAEYVAIIRDNAEKLNDLMRELLDSPKPPPRD
jgi:GAF domain-containing protein